MRSPRNLSSSSHAYMLHQVIILGKLKSAAIREPTQLILAVSARLGVLYTRRRVIQGFNDLLKVCCLPISSAFRPIYTFLPSKPGVARDPQVTKQRILNYLELATYPKKGSQIDADQKSDGVQDKLAQVLIDKLVKRGKELKQKKEENIRSHTNAEIHQLLTELKVELLKGNSEDKFVNSLLSVECKRHHTYFSPSANLTPPC